MQSRNRLIIKANFFLDMLKEKYQKEVVPLMQKKFGYKSPMVVPKIKKVIVNAGIGKILQGQDPSKRQGLQEHLSQEIALITGQKPQVTLAKKAISTFSIKKGSPVGLKVTLRKNRMYEFLGRMIYYALPRKRDFRGIDQNSIDQKGNLTVGIPEHMLFPEIQPEKSKVIFGLEVTLVANAKTKKEALELFKLLGFPFKKQ